MRNSITLSTRFRIFIHNRRSNWDRPSKLLHRRYPARHILRSSPLPLCSIHGCCLRHICRIHSLISALFRHRITPTLIKGTIFYHVYRSKLNLLPSTFPRPSGDAATVFRLPRRLHNVKHNLINRLFNFLSRSYLISFFDMRSLRFPARCSNPLFY